MDIAKELYYLAKPFLPKHFVLFLRRIRTKRMREKYAHIWPIDPEAGRAPDTWPGWPGGKKFALVLTHDVDTAEGLERCQDLAEMEIKMGFRSCFNFVAEDYHVDPSLFRYLKENGFEIGVHGLSHKGNPFRSKAVFFEQVPRINQYLKDWGAVGFRAPSMYHNLEWMGDLNIEYDMSTFDTDPFEPQPDGVGTIFPFWVPATRNVQLETRNSSNPSNPTNPSNPSNPSGFVELPYTLPQDHCLFILMKESDIHIWTQKLHWIHDQRGMVLLNTHPDYMNFSENGKVAYQYPATYYQDFLHHIRNTYADRYWHVLPREVSRFMHSKTFTPSVQ